MQVPRILKVAWTAAKAWKDDNVPRLGASLAYYTLFAIGPVLLVAIAVAGTIFGEEAARGQMVSQIQNLVGREGAEAVQAALAGASPDRGSIPATIIGVATFLLAATGAFMELQAALNRIWRVKSKSGAKLKALASLKAFALKRLKSFGLVVSIGFLLMVSLAVSAAVSALDGWMSQYLPGAPVLVRVINLGVSLLVFTLLFMMVYRILPDVHLRWRDVWTGAFATAILFTVGKDLIGLYIGNSSTASTYGAAGSIVVLLVWVYYSAQIVLYGAEFTRVYTQGNGVHPRPEQFADKETPGSDRALDQQPADEPAWPARRGTRTPG